MSAARVLGVGVMIGLLVACGGVPRGAEAPADEHTGTAASADGTGTTHDASAADREDPSPNAGASTAESGSPEGRSPDGQAASPAATAALAVGAGLPKTCEVRNDLCLPPRAFAKKLCQDAYTGAAIALLEKGSPFSRGYVRSREVKAVNTLGGPASDSNLRFGEEVLILIRTGGPGPGEMQVSGMGGYEVLRWDGTCATLGDGELALRAPVAPRHAPVTWRYIDSNIQAALLMNARVDAARKQHRKHCHGVSLGRISAACAKAEAELGESIVAAVRMGIELPPPERLP